MKLFRITFLFILLSFSAFAGDSTEFKRFAFGIHASPDYCFRSTNNSFREGNELPMISYTAGFDVSFFTKKQFAVSLGVNFSQKGFKSKIHSYMDANGETLKEWRDRYNYNYLEIPLKANFVFGKNKVRFLSGVGVSSAFMLYQQTTRKIKYNDGSKETSKEKPNYIYNPFNLFVTMSIGVDCTLGKKMGLRIEPTYSYGLLGTIDSYYSEHLWSAGLNIGCYIGF